MSYQQDDSQDWSAGTYSSNSPYFEARDVTVKINQHCILNKVSMNISLGEVVAILGPSGCGKSTFITTLNGMIRYTLPAAKVEADIRLGEKSIPQNKSGQEYLRRKVAMVFQRPNPFPFSIQKNLEFAIKAAGIDNRGEISDRIESSLRTVHLWEKFKSRLKDSASCLSGGEQQRLCIARSLVSQPKVILLDEPCSALDPVSCNVIEELLHDLRKQTAICIVTHNIPQAQRVSDRCLVFWPGDDGSKVIETGPTEDIVRYPTNPITRAYFKGEYC